MAQLAFIGRFFTNVELAFEYFNKQSEAFRQRHEVVELSGKVYIMANSTINALAKAGVKTT